MEPKPELHNYKNKLQATVRLIENDGAISETNRKLFLDFKGACLAEGVSIGRTARYLQNLKGMCKMAGFEWSKATKADFVELVGIIEANSSFSPWTKQFYKVSIKKFFRFVKDTDKDHEPEEVRWIKTTIKRNDKTIPKNYPTEADVKKLVDNCTNPRDKAFIIGLYESGCRVSEWTLLKIKDITFQKQGLKVVVAGKTGERKLLLVLSLPHIKNWLAVHPDADNPDAFLWVNTGTRARGELMTYAAVRIMINTVGARAGLLNRETHNGDAGKYGKNRYYTYSGKVDLNPHNFRHARASVLANHLTEAQMNYFFGWGQGSKMPAVYVHLSGKELDNALADYYGITEGKGSKKDKLATLRIKVCPRCEAENKAFASFCASCGLPLDVRQAVQIAEVEAGAAEFGAELIESGKSLKQELEEIKEKLAELGAGSNPKPTKPRVN